MTILTNIIADMIQTHSGQRSMAENYRYLMSQQVPQRGGHARAGRLGAAADQQFALDNEQALQLYDHRAPRRGSARPDWPTRWRRRDRRRMASSTRPARAPESVAAGRPGRLASLAAAGGPHGAARDSSRRPWRGRWAAWRRGRSQWQLGELTQAVHSKRRRATTSRRAPGMADPASETAFLEPLGPIDFAQGPFAGYAAWAGPRRAHRSCPRPRREVAADALPAMHGVGHRLPVGESA